MLLCVFIMKQMSKWLVSLAIGMYSDCMQVSGSRSSVMDPSSPQILSGKLVN